MLNPEIYNNDWQNVNAEVTITNTGKFKSDEVVQLYLAHQSLAGAPLYALKNFKRITLASGASIKVNFNITPDQLKIINDKGNAVSVTGSLKVIVGGSSPGIRGETLGTAKHIETLLTIK